VIRLGPRATGGSRISAWKDNEIFDFIKQSYLLSARYVCDVVSHVDGLDEKTRSEGRFLRPPVRGRHVAVELRADQSGSIAQNGGTAAENLLKGLNNRSRIWSKAKANSVSK